MEIKFYLQRVKFLKSGGTKIILATEHNSLAEAQAKYHRNISEDLLDETLSGSVSVITDSTGERHDRYSWGEILNTVTE